MILAAPLAGQEDLVKGLFAGFVVFVAHPQLGVIDDRRQHVVELVRGRADQFAQGGQLLGLGQLLLEHFDLLLKIHLLTTVAA